MAAVAKTTQWEPEQERSGLIQDLPFADYLADPAMSSSRIKTMLKSAAHFRHEHDNPRADTDAMALGRAVHAITLEGNSAFNREFAVAPQVDRRTKAGKEEWAAFVAESAGRNIITSEQATVAKIMACSVIANPDARQLIEGAMVEVSAFVTDENGMRRKARADILPKGRIIGDLKTTKDASPQGFARAIATYGYHIQAAWYLDAFSIAVEPKKLFRLIAVESSPPYAVSVYELDQESIAVGRHEYKKALRQHLECTQSGVWPGYTQGLELIGLPNWMIHQFENEIEVQL